MDALQLDMAWPEPDAVRSGVSAGAHRRIEVILQVGSAAFAAVGNGPRALVGKLRAYDGAIQRVLLDRSGGKGVALVPQDLLPFARAIREELPGLGIGVAGGLGAENVDGLLEPFVREFPDVSVDAQTLLCVGGNALNPLDLKAAELFAVRSAAVLP